MAHRYEKFVLFSALGLFAAMPACTSQADIDSDDELDEGKSNLAASGSFQNGVSPSSAYAGVTDTTIRESTPTTNEGAAASIAADFDDPAGTRKHTAGLLRFDIRSIPAGSKVKSVSLTVNVTNRTSGSGYSLYPLSRAWTESQTTWRATSSSASWAVAGASASSDRGSTAIASLTPTAVGKATITFNAAGLEAVQQWVNDSAKNFGFIVDTVDNADGLAFDSSNAASATNRPRLVVSYDTPQAVASPYPLYTKAEVDAWSTSNPQYARLAGSWAGNVNRSYPSYGTQVSTANRDILRDESVYLKSEAVLWAADGNAARKTKIVERLNAMKNIRSWQWDSVEQYRLVAGWALTNLAQAASIVGYKDAGFTAFLRATYDIMDWPGANNWTASFADSKLAVAVYLGDAALYADAKSYFYTRLPQTAYVSKYDGNKVKPVLKNGSADISATIRNWGGYFGAPQVKSDLTFVNPSYVTDGFNAETIRDLSHVSMGLGGWMHAALTIEAHGDTLSQEAYDRIRASYVLQAKRVLAYKNTGKFITPAPINGDGGAALNLGWYGARKLFGNDTPADVVTLLSHPDVTGSGAAGALHLSAEAFADGM